MEECCHFTGGIPLAFPTCISVYRAPLERGLSLKGSFFLEKVPVDQEGSMVVTSPKSVSSPLTIIFQTYSSDKRQTTELCHASFPYFELINCLP